jgi:hypothetical protein
MLGCILQEAHRFAFQCLQRDVRQGFCACSGILESKSREKMDENDFIIL